MILDKPIEGVTVDQRLHPAGREGSLLSLKEVAERAWKSRMSPRLRAWTTQKLDEAGVSSGTRRQKAQAVLDAYRKKVPYMADPVMGEFIATPEQTLCLDNGGLCIVGGDCDDGSVTLAAAMMSIGIPAMIIGSSHKHPYEVPTHVFLAFQDEQSEWVRMDGTTKHPVGKVSPHQREWWVEPGKEAKDRGEGDFVGMAGGSEVGVSGPASLLASKLDLLYPSIR
jgi:transglutaminase-like putative cysteine protease